MGTSPFTAQTTGIMKCLLFLATLTLLGVCSAQRRPCEDGEHRFGTRRGFICASCSPGTAGVGGTCPACQPGFAQSESGQFMCNVCPMGTWQNRQRQRTCHECPDGLTTATTGATSIEECIGYEEPCSNEVEITFERHQFTQAHGAQGKPLITERESCLEACKYAPNCLAVDWNISQNPWMGIFCWLHVEAFGDTRNTPRTDHYVKMVNPPNCPPEN